MYSGRVNSTMFAGKDKSMYKFLKGRQVLSNRQTDTSDDNNFTHAYF